MNLDEKLSLPILRLHPNLTYVSSNGLDLPHSTCNQSYLIRKFDWINNLLTREIELD